jgi:acyl-CoA thioesterase-1
MSTRYQKMVAVALLSSWACGGAPGGETPEASPQPTVDGRARVLVLGTSLTAGLGLRDRELAYPALLQRRIDEAGLGFRVVEAGVSGETSAGALSRIDWLLSEPIAVLVLETGANDGLRGLDAEALRGNLQGIVERARRQAPAPEILLLGMRAVRNLGSEYGARLAAVYEQVAETNDLTLVPFLLEGVGGVEDLNQADGIHPTPEGHGIMAGNVWRELRPILERLADDHAESAPDIQ